MKLFQKSLIVSSLALASLAANAADSNMYGSVGMTALKADLGFSVSGVTIDDDDTAPMVMLGYKINDTVSLEAGVVGSSEVSASASGSASGTLNGKSISVSAAGTVKAEADNSYMLGAAFNMPVAEKLTATARAGMLWWDVDYVASGTLNVTYDGTTTAIAGSKKFASNDGSDVYLGVGMNYEVADDVSISADYMRTEVDGADIDAYTLSAVMRF